MKKERKAIKKVCENCGKEFETLAYAAKFCDECKAAKKGKKKDAA